MHMANIDNIIQSNLGLIHVNSTEPTE
jgi:hypothetical protein